MRGLLKAFNFKGTAILFSLILTSCGSGGGVDIGGGGGGGCDDTPVGTTALQQGASIQSKDKRATVTNDHDIGNIEVTIGVNCTSSHNDETGTQIGRSYYVKISGTPTLTLSYKDVSFGSIPETGLRLGDYDPSTGWGEQPAVQNSTERTFALQLSDPGPLEYAIFVPPGGGKGSPPTTPTQVQATPVSGTCAIIIQWNSSTDPDGDLALYKIARSGIQIGIVTATGNPPQCAPGTRCSFQDDASIIPPPIQGTQYFYTVTASDSQGNNSNSGTSNGVIAPSQCPQQ